MNGQPSHGDMPVIGLDMVILQSVCQPMVLVPGHELRGQACILCDKAIGGSPFVIIHMAIMQRCGCGLPEIPGTTMMRHETCAQPRDQVLANIIQSKLS